VTLQTTNNNTSTHGEKRKRRLAEYSLGWISATGGNDGGEIVEQFAII